MTEAATLPDREPLCLFTVGHSNHAIEVFVQLLKKHGIELVADVRSSPYSRYVQHFNREGLRPALAEAGVMISVGKPGRIAYTTPAAQVTIHSEIMDGLEC